MTSALLLATVMAAEVAAPVQVEVADLPAIMAAVKAPGAAAVLVNVWATWCEPCREEMPDLVRFYREHRAQGLRMVLVSADDEDQRAQVARVLAGLRFDGSAFIKRGDDMAFIDALDPSWKGSLPATFLFDGRGTRSQAWHGLVTYDDLRAGVSGLLDKSKKPKKAQPKPPTNQPRRER
jgi:thiol-disulfide isomerase/thioredoxin